MINAFATPVNEWDVMLVDAGAKKIQLQASNNAYLAICAAAAQAVEPPKAGGDDYDAVSVTGQYTRLSPATNDKTTWMWTAVTNDANTCRVTLTNCSNNKELMPCPNNQCPTTTGAIKGCPAVAGQGGPKYAFDVQDAGAAEY
jgi:hypothetical protein